VIGVIDLSLLSTPTYIIMLMS